MTVRRDKNTKKWFYYGCYIDSLGNKKWYKKRGFDTKKEALLAEVDFLEKAKQIKITLKELIKKYESISKKRVKDSTYMKHHYVFNKLIRTFGEQDIHSFDRWKLQEFIDDMDSKYSKRYVEKIYYVTHSLFRFAVEYELLDKNPMQYVRRDLRRNELPVQRQFWELEDFNKFIVNVDKEMYKVLFMTLYYMGIRKGEAFALQFKDIDFKNRTISISKTCGARDRWKNPPYTSPKTKNSYRTIKMPKILYDTLKAWCDQCSHFTCYDSKKFVFGFDRPLPADTVRRNFKKWIELTNRRNRKPIPVIRIHDLRHSHASYLINNMSYGFTDFDIANRLGDTVATLHNTYSHWFKKADASIIDFIDLESYRDS